MNLDKTLTTVTDSGALMEHTVSYGKCNVALVSFINSDILYSGSLIFIVPGMSHPLF